MPQSLTSQQLGQYIHQINVGGLDAARQVYAELYSKGYNYAGWAHGVATGETITGQAALDYMQGSAMMGIGSEACRNLTQAQIDQIRVDMAKAYLDKLSRISLEGGGDSVDRDMDFKETSDIHRQVFEQNGISNDNWTLKVPMDLIGELHGEQAVEQLWARVRDTGGDGLDGLAVSTELASRIGRMLSSPDPDIRRRAAEWVDRVPGFGNWEQIDRSIEIFHRFLQGRENYSGDPFTGMPWPGIDPNVNDEFRNALNPPRRDPLAVDMDGDGIETVGLPAAGSPVLFDHDADGVKTGTGWLQGDDAWLVLDRNGNGTIDSGRELFGADTLITVTEANPQTQLMQTVTRNARTGFEALRSLDTGAGTVGSAGYGDGVFDAKDAAFTQVRLWHDVNQDGISQGAELLTLSEAGVVSIGAVADTTVSDLENGNVVTGQATVLRSGGNTTQVASLGLTANNLNLADNPFYREFADAVPLTAAASALPEMKGSGWVRDLREAMSLGTPQGAALAANVKSFSAVTTRDAQMAMLDDLLRLWAETNQTRTLGPVNDPHRRFVMADGNPTVSAQMQAMIPVLEVFNGMDVTDGGMAVWMTSIGSDGQTVSTFRLLNDQLPGMLAAYSELRENLYSALVVQTRLRPYLNVDFLKEDASGIHFDTTALSAMLAAVHAVDEQRALEDLADLMKYAGSTLREVGFDGLGMLRPWVEAIGASSPLTPLLAQMNVFVGDVAHGGARADVYLGNAAGNTFAGMDGDDHIDGGAGDDSLTGDAGDDLVRGGLGNDTVSGGGGNDLLDGDAGDDRLLGSAGDDSVRGGVGNDTVSGDDGNDLLDGGQGDDWLLGGAGDDTLSGGETMVGGSGSDTYLLSSLSPRFTITEDPESAANHDVLVMPDGVEASSLTVNREHAGTGWFDDLVLRDTNNSIVLRIAGYFNVRGDSQKVEEIRFADGTVWSPAYVLAQLPVLTEETDLNVWGFRDDDVIHGLGGDDDIYGFTGNDNVFGDDGRDHLWGGDGNDTLDGGAGSDLLQGGGGDDTFVFGTSSGFDTITDESGVDRILLASGVMPSDVQLLRDGADLRLRVSPSGAQLLIRGQFAGGATPIDRIEFADGSAWDSAGIQSRTITGTLNTATGTAGNDVFVVDNAGDTIIEAANGGNDTVQSSVSYTLGANVENLTLTGVMDLNASGNSGNNVLRGNAGHNILGEHEPRATTLVYRGADTMLGGAGDDTYHVGADSGVRMVSDDTVIELAGEGNDTVVVSTYDYTLPDHVENLRSNTNQDWVQGSGLARRLTGNALDNVISGLGWNAPAVLDGGAGNDTMYGSAGNDTYIVDQAGDRAVEYEGGVDTVRSSVDYVLPSRVENLTLTGGNAIGGRGNELHNVLDGRANSAGNELVGGRGDDTYWLGGGDSVVEAANAGVDTVGLDTAVLGTYAVSSFANVEGMALGASMGQSGLLGSSGNDRLTGNGFGNVLDGGSGDDVLNDATEYFATDSDLLLGGAGNDILESRGGADTLEGGAGQDLLRLHSRAAAQRDASGPLTVRFNQGDGQDTLTNDGWGDVRIVCGAGIDASALQLTRSGTAVLLSFGTGGDSISLQNFFSDDTSAEINAWISSIEFADGTVLDGAFLLRRALGGTNAGTSGSDAQLGSQAADSLSGLAGNDTVMGLGGNDTLMGGEGDDLLLGGAGVDEIAGGAGSDRIQGGTGADVIRFGRGDGIDQLMDCTGDTLRFAADITPDQVRVTSEGPHWRIEIADTGDYVSLFNFAFGENQLNVAFADGTVWDAATLFTLAMTVTGTDGADYVSGNAWDNQLYGLAGDDELSAQAGNDRLDGGSGADTMYGGDGDDLFTVDHLGDTVVENPNEGSDSVISSVSFTLGDNVENLTLTGSAVSGTGNGLANTLVGNAASNTLTGGAGNDSLDGAAGNDSMAGGTGNDTYVVDSTADVVTEGSSAGTDIVLSSATWTMGANVEQLVLTGAAAINGTGNTLANRITGNAAANTLSGGTGADSLIGGAGDDTYIVDNTADVVTEAAGEGLDRVHSSASFTLAANVENLTLTGTSAISGTGNTLDNLLTGNSANNTLSGGAGNDVLDGAAGNDTLVGGAGDDTYLVGSTADVVTEGSSAGTDIVQSSATWTMSANVEQLVLTGAAAINGTGNTLANRITGNGAANTLSGGTGADTLIGGAGNDIYIVDNTADVVTEAAGQGTDGVQSSVTLTLAANVENLTLTGTAAINGTGNTLDNLLTGNSANNLLTGGAGNDVLDGAAGSDTLAGGAGNDTYVVNIATDVVTEVAGEGADTVQSAVTYTLGAELENLSLTGSSTINGTGNALNNQLVGNSANNTLDGGLGNDTLVGGAGNDTYVVNVTTDVITEAAGAGTDTVQSAVAWTLGAELENLSLSGSSAINGTGNTLDNRLVGNSANNTLTGAAGNDTLDGGLGSDTLVGGTGNDTYVVNVTTDVVTEGAAAGTDTVQAAVTWSLGAELENLSLTGGSAISGTGNAGANVLTGNSGSNTLSGLAGADTLDGGAGSDTLVGGLGNDVYVMGLGRGADVVQENDSTAGNTDLMRFTAGVTAEQIWFRQVGSSLEVSIIGTGDKATLQNWYSGSQYHVEQFRTADGRTLLDSKVQELVSAMAGFAPPAAGQTTLPSNYQSSLLPLIAADWTA